MNRAVAHLDLATLRLESSAYVDAVLDPRASDLLHSVRLCGTHHRVAVYIALDHQSSRDGLMPWRSLEYIVDLWDRHIQAQPKPPRKLPFILPILLLQRPAWTTPTRLSDIIDLPAELRNAFGAPVELELLVDDLGGTVLDDPYADEGTLAFVELTRALLYAHENPGAATEERLARLAPLFDTVLEHQDPGDVDSANPRHTTADDILSRHHDSVPFMPPRPARRPPPGQPAGTRGPSSPPETTNSCGVGSCAPSQPHPSTRYSWPASPPRPANDPAGMIPPGSLRSPFVGLEAQRE